jgi:Dolichyl-phosphate-mannose-protein mannosyltransferase
MKTLLGRNEKMILVGLVLFALFFRLGTLMMIHTGVDERDYWFSAKAIAHGLPYPDINHRTTRFTVILPVAGAQLLLGSHPDVYYVLPVLNSMIQAALAFVIGLRLRGRLTAFLAALAITLFPYLIRAGSQVRPEIFSITYVFMAVLLFMEYLERTERETAPLIWTAVWIFIAYEAKITNLFFVPGLLAAVLVYKKKPMHAILFCGVLLALFLAETGAYAIFTSYKLGELEIIFRKHVHDGEPFHVARFVDLFQRYSLSHLQVYWQIPFVLFAAAAVFYLVRGTDRRISALTMAAISFFLGITFEVAGLHPIIPAEGFINRYFSAVLAPVFLVLAYAGEGIVAKLRGHGTDPGPSVSPRGYLGVLGLLVVLFLCFFSLPGLPAGVQDYVNSPLHPLRHPLVVNERYRLEINRAYTAGMPIVAVDGLGGDNAIRTCLNYYIDLSNYANGRLPAIAAIQKDGKGFLVVSRPGSSESGPTVLAALRMPFRIAEIPATGLGNLSDNSLTGGVHSTGQETNE